jgi:hypothetical protein
MKLLDKGVTMKVKTYKPEEEKNYKTKQQDLTELNGDGNRDRGRYGEDLTVEEKEHNHCGTPECCGECDTADVTDG